MPSKIPSKPSNLIIFEEILLHLKSILPSKVSNRGKKDQDLRRFKTLSEKLKVNVEKPKTSFEEIGTTLKKEGDDFVTKT